jgi:transcriptional regulator with XRE-family HTH domain
MSKEPRLLTITQFAKEKGVNRNTIRNWIKGGRLEGVVSDCTGIPRLIPDTNLSVPIRSRGRKHSPPISISSEEEMKLYYHSNKRKIPLTYDEFKNLVARGLSYQAIADKVGVSRQAVEQVYKKYFAPFGSPQKERRKEFIKKRHNENRHIHIKSIDKLILLEKIVNKVGLKIEPIPIVGSPNKSKHGKVVISNRVCGVHHTISTRRVGSNGRNYYKPCIAKDTISSTEFTIFICGKRNPKVYIVPSNLISDTLFSDLNKIRWYLYIPSKILPVYNNRPARINWEYYLNNWGQLNE